MDAVTLSCVNVNLGKRQILKNITASFCYGRIHGIVGLNGSGKSVMFKTIIGLIQPDSGCITVNGIDWQAKREFAQDIGFLIESPGFLNNLSGFDNLRYLSSLRVRLSNEQLRDAMQMVGLNPDERKSVRSYSLGMKQRLGIAQALMERGHVLILDEPFNGLDKQGILLIRELVKAEREKGVCILLSSHNQADIDALCDDICEIDAGALTQLV